MERSRIEAGVNAPSLETMESIARAFEVEIKDLFEFIHLQAGWVKAEEIENCWMERMRNKND